MKYILYITAYLCIFFIYKLIKFIYYSYFLIVHIKILCRQEMVETGVSTQQCFKHDQTKL